MTMNPRHQARHELERARLMGDLRDFLAVLRGHDNELLPFDWVKYLSPEGEHTLGVRPIPVDHIIGSVDRYREFDRHYLPKEKHLDERWIGVRTAQLRGQELPPIQVYKVGELYFVKDGNHRVSVARRQGQHYIDADVIELNVSVPPDEDDTLKDLIIKGEYARFLRETRLGSLVPGHRAIVFTAPGRYDKLLDHIRTHQYFLDEGRSQEGKPPVTWEQAVRSWYADLYTPILRSIDEHHVMYRFPGRTEADLYLWIMDHRHFLWEHGEALSGEQATLHFSEHHAPSALRRLGQRWRLRLTGEAETPPAAP